MQSNLFLGGLLGEENGLNVGKDTTLGNGDTAEELVQLLVVPDGELQVSWDDPALLVVAGGVACQLKHFGAQVLQNGGQVDRSASADALRVVAFPEQSVNATDWKLQTRSG